MDQRRTSIQAFWETPELIAMCFDFMDKRSLSACARLSKGISEHALDLLYRDVQGYVQTLKLLCSMEQDGSGNLVRLFLNLPPLNSF